MADILKALKPNEFNKSGDDSWRIYAEFIDSMTTYLAKNPNTQHLVADIGTLLSNENDSDMTNVVKKLSNNEEFKKAIGEYFEELFPMNAIRMEFGKNHDEATQAFRLGEESHSRKDYVDALNHYSKAIRFAEHETSDHLLTTLYWQRAMVFYFLKKFYDCVVDLQELLRYPDCTIIPWSQRALLMAEAAVHLTGRGNRNLLIKVWHFCEGYMLSAVRSGTFHLRNLIDMIKANVMRSIHTTETQLFGHESENRPFSFKFELEERNKSGSIEGASRKLYRSYFYDKKYRGYRARGEISDGELVFVEKPFAVHYFLSTNDTHCGNCLKRLYIKVPTDCRIDSRSSSLELSALNDAKSSENFHMEYCSFVPCRTCNKFIFCNNECMNEAYKRFHKRECKGNLFAMESQMGIGYLVARLISAVDDDIIVKEADLNNPSAIINKRKDIKGKYENVQSQSKGDYSDILKLMDHRNEHDNRSKICFILTAFFLEYCFEKMHFSCQSPQQAKPDRLGFKLLIIHHLHQLSTNLMTIYEQEFVAENLSESEELPIGIGIYPNIALFNHSCEPDLIPIFLGCKMVLKSVKKIRVGEEVCISYGPTYYNFSYKKRQKWLKEQYFFKCACEACLERKEGYNYAFLCNVCNGPAMLEYRDEAELKPYLLCRYGHEIEDLQPILAKIKNGIEHRKAGEHFLDQGVRKNDSDDIVAALVSFFKADVEFTDTLYCLNYVWINLKSQMIDCYLKMGQYERAAIYSRQIIDSYKRYPKHRELLMPNIREHIRLVKIILLLVEELDLPRSNSESGSIEGSEQEESVMVEDEDDEFVKAIIEHFEELKKKKEEAEGKEAKPETTAKADACYGQEIVGNIETAINAVEAISPESSPSDLTVPQEANVSADIDDYEDLEERILKLSDYYGEIIWLCDFCAYHHKILPQDMIEFMRTIFDKIRMDEYYDDPMIQIFNQSYQNSQL